MEIKDYVKNCKVRFVFYRDGQLWYEVIGGPTALNFPVPISDVGNATFNCEDKALLFMRYIREHIKFIDKNVQFECEYCKDSGLMHFNGSPSNTLMGPCEFCNKGKEIVK